jgi:tight adherence protein C
MIRSVTPPERPRSPADGLAAVAWSPERVLKRLESQPPDAFTADLTDSTLAHVTECVAQALPETKSGVADLKNALKRAGDYRPRAYQELATVRYVGMLASLVVFGTLTILASKAAEPWCVLGLAVGMLASWRLPVWQLRRRAARRIDEIEQAIPDLRDMINVCLSQGLTVPVALATASRELRPIHPALADELAIVCRQAELDSLEAALDDFERRLDLPEIRSFVTHLLQADETGPGKHEIRMTKE